MATTSAVKPEARVSVSGLRRNQSMIPITPWRGFGWKDGAEDCERFRRALFEGRVRTAPSLLLRSAFAEAITLVDPAGNHKLAKGRSTGRIDAAAATVLAVAQGVRMAGAPSGGGRLIWA